MRTLGKAMAVERIQVCERCGEILAYTPLEMTKKTRTDYTGDPSQWYEITCEVCKANLTVPWPTN